MRKLIFSMLLILLTSSVVFASGDKNHGTTGKGTNSTGSSSQGSATQQRSGR
ncbi:MAG: hypothetical protein ABH952_00700 [Candidatus Omnitrophota bacterium]